MISSAIIDSKTSFKHVNPVSVSIPKGSPPKPRSSVRRQYIDVQAILDAHQRIAVENHTNKQSRNHPSASVHVEKPNEKDNIDARVIALLDHQSLDKVRGHVELSEDRVIVTKGQNVRSHGNKPYSEGVKFSDISNQSAVGEMVSHSQVRDVLEDPANIVPPDVVRQLKGSKQFDTSVVAHASAVPKHNIEPESLGYLSYMSKYKPLHFNRQGAPGNITLFDADRPDTFRSALKTKVFVTSHIAKPSGITTSSNITVPQTHQRYNDEKSVLAKNVHAQPIIGRQSDMQVSSVLSGGHHKHRDVSNISYIDRATKIIV
ncbi:hypothetical protein [Scale drop disease virus]|uniref:ORF_031L n=1 Tax=Scale drop disease virus TaxID=1697349 RepID=A0A0K1L655_9VIRU|nr:ORF_031L [Scale drop disease virus]AKU37446.1 ORF_031L [Scale drop disease virus]QLI60704.1 hypothetical protein [Scale drop disease virus]QXJ13622.1 ORF031L [Scale drop disease virus]UNH60751.1 proteasome accessory factor [Scale drop disease virus]